MLTDYQQQVRLLMGDATFARFNDFDFRTWINFSRAQVAGQGLCVRQLAVMPLANGNRSNSFLNITGLVTGTLGVYHIRQFFYPVGGGQTLVTSRPFEWFGLYALNNPTPSSGPPLTWTQLGQGEQGTVYVDPIPDMDYLCPVEVVCVPVPLVDDATVEAIPPIWTLAVPYYAAWLAFMSAQQQEQADKMLGRFQEQMLLARNAANPDLLMENWSQSRDFMLQNRLGVQPKGTPVS